MIFERPKHFDAYMKALPTDINICRKELQQYGSMLYNFELTGQSGSDQHYMILQVLSHLRYRYIILANCQDPESVVFKRSYEMALPDMIYRLPHKIEALSFIQEDLVEYETPVETVELVIKSDPPVAVLEDTSYDVEEDTTSTSAEAPVDVALSVSIPVDGVVADVELPVDDSDLDSCFSSDCERQHDDCGHHILPAAELQRKLLIRRKRNLHAYRKRQEMMFNTLFLNRSGTVDVPIKGYDEITFRTEFENSTNRQYDIDYQSILRDEALLKEKPVDPYFSLIHGEDVHIDKPEISGMHEWKHSTGFRRWLYDMARATNVTGNI